MRVLMVCPELPSVGRPGSMAPALRQFESLEELGVEVETYDMRGISVLKYLVALPRIRLRSRGVDIVHSHFGFCGWLVFLATLLMRRRPKRIMSYMGDDLLGTPYNEDGDLERFSCWMVHLNKWLAKKFDRVIVKSSEMSRVLAPTSATVVPNGVDVSAFCAAERNAARQEIGVPQQGLYVLFPGNPENPRKGYRLAKAAVEEAQEIVGQSIGILTLWEVSPEQVPLFMSAANLMTMTSLIEGSPNVVKEAMACNVPIVSVRVGDTLELLEGVPGCYLCERRTADLAEGIVNAIRDGQSGGRRAIEEKELDLSAVAQRVLAIYQETTDSGELEPSRISTHEISAETKESSSPGEACYTTADSEPMEAV
ncbi:MAG: glycosyltransferase family 4 protein [Aureliella sp.]